MRPIKPLLSASLLAIWCLWTAPASPAEIADSGEKAVLPQKAEQVLSDFRNYVYTKPNLVPGEKDKLLSQLFPKYLKKIEDCDFDEFPFEDNSSKDDEHTGQFTPSVASVSRGAFTGPGRKETVYLIHMGECHGGRNFWTSRLIIVARSRILMQQEVPALHIRKAADLDGDGVQELLLESVGTMGGFTETFARLLSVSQGSLKVLKDFQNVAVDSCGTEKPDSNILASVIAYRTKGSGITPEFHSYNYEAKCPAQGTRAVFKPTSKSLNE